ncbi:unnamed protein product [Discosporangium mesarthrocarpum]
MRPEFAGVRKVIGDKLHKVDYEVHLERPQIKLVGKDASLLLSAEAADVEACTYGEDIVVVEAEGEARRLRRKEVRVGLGDARVFTLPTGVEDAGAQRWLEYDDSGREHDDDSTDDDDDTLHRGRSESIASPPILQAPRARRTSAVAHRPNSIGGMAPRPLSLPLRNGGRSTGIGLDTQRGQHPGQAQAQGHGLTAGLRKFWEEEVQSSTKGSTWKRRSTRQDQAAKPTYFGLREAMRDFNAHARYVFHEDIKCRQVVAGHTRRVQHCPTNRLSLDVPELFVHLDARQFYEVLDVVRNLLLAPPPMALMSKVKKRRKKNRIRGCLDSDKLGIERGKEGHDKNKPYDISSKHDREHLKEVVEATLQLWGGTVRRSSVTSNQVSGQVQEGMPGYGLTGSEPRTHELTRIRYRIGRCTWRLMMSPDSMQAGEAADLLEIGLTGLSSCHTYLEDASGSGVPVQNVLFQVERLWVQNLCPGEEAFAAFADASAVLQPRLGSTEPCQACGDYFEPESNSTDSCRFHGTDDGELGEFLLAPAASKYSENGEPCPMVGRWSCCGSTWEGKPGCMPRPHEPKEVMVSLRAEGGPSVLAGTTQVSVFKHLEVNIFPSVSYELALQMTRGVAVLLQKYFNGEYKPKQEEGIQTVHDQVPAHHGKGKQRQRITGRCGGW